MANLQRMMQANVEEGKRRQAPAEASEARANAMVAEAIGTIGALAGLAGGGAGADGASSCNQPQGSQAPPPTHDAIPRPGAASTPRTGPLPPSVPGNPPPPAHPCPFRCPRG